MNEIQDVLDEWERTMGVPMLSRHYSRTELAVDRNQNSFSSFIAQHYAKQLLTGKYSIQAILLGAIEASSKQGFTSKNPRNIFRRFILDNLKNSLVGNFILYFLQGYDK